jgi:hypothetical protein
MTTLADCYQLFDRKPASFRIVIGGVDLTEIVSVTYSHGIQKVPTASIRIRGAVPASCVFNAGVEIYLGFWAWQQRVFTGTVLHPDNSDATGTTIECQGMSACLDNPYHKVIVNVDGSRTIPQLIGDILAASGAPDYSVNMPTWTAGAVVPQVLTFQTYGEAITKLAEVNGGRWYETPAGTIKVEPKDPVPGPAAWRNYFSMILTGGVESYPAGITTGRPRLRKCGMVRRAREVKNQVWVRGAVLTQANPDGSQSSVSIEEHAFAPSPWVLNPDGSQAYNDELYSNEIIDTIAIAGAEAGRRVNVKNRLLTQVDVGIDGDPEVQAGVTVDIEDPNYSAVSGRWFVESLTTTLSGGHFETTLTLLGGPKAGGAITVAPFANFIYSLEYEIMGDRPWLIATFDGSLSVDPDGTIASWCWTDNQTPMKATGCAQSWTTRVDPTGIVSPWEVTLTVEDNDGATDDLMLSIPYQSSQPAIQIPALFVAFYTAASASPDGGLTWNDQVIAGKTVISVSARPADGTLTGYAVFGTTDGCLYRTTDFCASAPVLVHAALGSPIAHVQWDYRNYNIVWAVTQNGLLYWSWDNGLSWALYDDLGALFGLAGTIRISGIGVPVAGGVWIFGGTGTGYPLICWDAVVGGHAWTGANLGAVGTSELMTDLDASAYPADLYIARASNRSDALCIILNSATHAPAVYCSASGGLGDGTDWKRALGDAGALAKTRGSWIDLDLTVGHYVLGFEDSVAYTMDVAAGVGTIAAAPAGFGTNCGNFSQSLVYQNVDGAYLLAAESMTGTSAGTIYKTWDRYGHDAQVRPATGFTAAPAGAKAKMLSLGAPVLGTPGRALLAAHLPSGKRFAAYRSGLTPWQKGIFSTELSGAGIGRVRALTPDLWFVLGNSDYCNANNRIVRTKNGSAATPTWASFTTPKSGNDYWIDFAMDAGGRLWGVTTDKVSDAKYIVKIWYSIDQGDNWTLSTTLTGTSALYPLSALTLSCHPNDQNKIALRSLRGSLIFHNGVHIAYTISRGASWNTNNVASLGTAFPAATGLKLCDNDRLIIWDYHSIGDSHIETSDDWGASWANRKTFAHAGTASFTRGAANHHGSKAFAYVLDDISGDKVFWSQDYGTNWLRFDNQPSSITFSGGLAYDDVDDALYCFANDNSTSNVGLVYRMSPVVQAGVWADFSDALVPVGADTKYTCSIADMIAMVPR